MRVHHLDIKQALRVQCGPCDRIALVPAYTLYARCKTLDLIHKIIPRLKCEGCGKRGERLSWDVVWNPEDYKPLKDDPAYTGFGDQPMKRFDG